jgi:glycosyltransferase involved in cell wall biosynthesis
MENSKSHGVSIVICCYNSAKRLPDTIKHLIKQEVTLGISWEVIVVDNASTDNTAQIAQSLWTLNDLTPLRVVKEPRPGLNHARIKGINEAKYEIVSFLDDDNWAPTNWVKLVLEIMTKHPEVGACGVRSEAETEIEPPIWFNIYSSGYVIGKQADKSGDITWSKGWLWGAGLIIRKKAWDDLFSNGFKPTLSGRSGDKVTSGEDVELCYALRLAGWRLWYSDELVLKHYITLERLTTNYLSKLQFGFGIQTVDFDPYNFYVNHKSSEVKFFMGKIWLRQILRELYISIFRDYSLWKKWMGYREKTFNHRMLWLRHWGRITTLLKNRKKYDYQIYLFDKNNWIRITRQTANYLSSNPDFGDAGNPGLNSNPLVTVLICNYNYGQFISEAIESALNQTWKNTEIIVVDDGSTDESREVLKKYEGRIHIIHKENGGQASAFNIGITHASGEIVCFLDSDDYWCEDKIEKVIAKYREASWGLVCHDLSEVGIPLELKNKKRSASFMKDIIEEGDAKKVILKNGFQWVFRPTSAMSLPRSVIQMIFPIPEREWRISADNPIAFASIFHAPFGFIQNRLGFYRYHSKNNFASVSLENRDKAHIISLILPLKCFYFLEKHLSKFGKKLNYHPDYNYRDYRKRIFISKNCIWGSYIKLFKSNYSFHICNSKKTFYPWVIFLKFCILDLLVALLITSNVPNLYLNMRKLFKQMWPEMPPHLQKYFSK